MESEAQELPSYYSSTANNNDYNNDEGLRVEEDNDTDRRGSDRTTRQEFSLPPVDGGKDAWLFLAGCFVTEALIWGEFYMTI